MAPNVNGVFFGCNGVDVTRWFPRGQYGTLTDTHLEGTANEALIPFRRKLLIPRGIHMAPRSGGAAPPFGGLIRNAAKNLRNCKE